MHEAEKIYGDQAEMTDARLGSAAAAWLVAWSLLLAFILLAPSGFAGAADYSAGRPSGISLVDRTHVLSLSSRDGSRQSVSADRKSAPYSRLDPPVALAGQSAIIRRCSAQEIAIQHGSARPHAFDPTGYDCRGPPLSTA